MMETEVISIYAWRWGHSANLLVCEQRGNFIIAMSTSSALLAEISSSITLCLWWGLVCWRTFHNVPVPPSVLDLPCAPVLQKGFPSKLSSISQKRTAAACTKWLLLWRWRVVGGTIHYCLDPGPFLGRSVSLYLTSFEDPSLPWVVRHFLWSGPRRVPAAIKMQRVFSFSVFQATVSLDLWPGCGRLCHASPSNIGHFFLLYMEKHPCLSSSSVPPSLQTWSVRQAIFLFHLFPIFLWVFCREL